MPFLAHLANGSVNFAITEDLCPLYTYFPYLSSSAKLLNQFEQSLAGKVFEKRIFRFV
jgi:hypothetical protein